MLFSSSIRDGAMQPFKRVAFGLMILALAGTLLSQVPAAPAPPPEPYVFVPDVSRLVGIYRGDLLLVGRLDAAGNFLQTERYKRGEAPKRAYEYRSEMLFRGVLDAEGHFVPEAGSKIIRFQEYKYDPDGPPIWNLPGRFVKRSTIEASEKKEKGKNEKGP